MSQVKKHFDKIAEDYHLYKKRYQFYYEGLKRLLKSVIPEGKVVLEVGCATGDLLYSVKPKVGYGIDISENMIKLARKKYKRNNNLSFSTKDVSVFKGKKLDFIFMSDVIEHLEDPVKTFADISKVLTKNTKLVITMVNPVWKPLLLVWEKLGWKMPEGPHNRIKFEEIENILEKTGLKVTRHDYRLLLPIKLPLITGLANKYLESPLKRFAFIEYFVVKKATKL